MSRGYAPERTENVDARVAAIARKQHGVFTRAQALKCGATRHMIASRIKTGRWERMYPRVYRHAGVPTTPRQQAIAVSLYLGPRAALSHRAAAWLRGLPDIERWRAEVTMPRNRHHHRLPHVRIHLPEHPLPDEDITTIDGIPVTRPARTLLDLAAVEPEQVVERCLDDCLRRKLVTMGFLERWLQDRVRRRHRGYKVLARLVEARANTAATESPVETDLLRLLREKSLPVPVVGYDVVDDGRFIGRVDFAYPEQRVCIEVDGFAHHDSRAQFDRERARANDLVVLGWQLLRVTNKHLESDPEGVAGWIRRALASRSGTEGAIQPAET